MPVDVRFVSYLLLAAIALTTIAKFAHFSATQPHQSSDVFPEHVDRKFLAPAGETSWSVEQKDAAQSEAAQSPFAFVAFLAANFQHREFEDDNEDVYFYSTRVMGYQLMHNPETRTNTSIPFVVLTTKGVSERKRARLRKDGAVVIVVDDVLLPEWFSIANPYWMDVMTKLRVFQQVQYQKILLLDADILPVRRLDGVFQDPATEVVAPLENKKRAGDHIPLPAQYMFAGMTMGGGREHDSETEEKYYASMAQYNELDKINAGFLLAAPSQDIYDYYTALLHEQGRFDPAQPEQNLLIEAHRVDGPMPWKSVRYDWVMNSPTFRDYENGVHAVHEKLWKEQSDEFGLNRLAALWGRARADMEGYYRAVENPSPITRHVTRYLNKEAERAAR